MSAPSCYFCANSNPAGAKFCNECGSPLHLKPCPRCEAITDGTATNCYQCGASFDPLHNIEERPALDPVRETEARPAFDPPHDTEERPALDPKRDTDARELFPPSRDTETRALPTSTALADATELDALDVEGVHVPDSLASGIDPDGRIDPSSERGDAATAARDGADRLSAPEYATRAPAKRAPARAKPYRRVAALLIAPAVVAAGFGYMHYRQPSVTIPLVSRAVVAKAAPQAASVPGSPPDVKRVEPPASPKAATDRATVRTSGSPVPVPPVDAGSRADSSIAPAVTGSAPRSLPRKASSSKPPTKPARGKNAPDPAALATERLIARDLAKFRSPADPLRTTPSKPAM